MRITTCFILVMNPPGVTSLPPEDLRLLITDLCAESSRERTGVDVLFLCEEKCLH